MALSSVHMHTASTSDVYTFIKIWQRQNQRQIKTENFQFLKKGVLRSIFGSLLAPHFKQLSKQKKGAHVRARTNLVITLSWNSHQNTTSKWNVKQIWKFMLLNWYCLPTQLCVLVWPWVSMFCSGCHFPPRDNRLTATVMSTYNSTYKPSPIQPLSSASKNMLTHHRCQIFSPCEHLTHVRNSLILCYFASVNML